MNNTRRNFLSTIAAAPLMALLPKSLQAKEKKPPFIHAIQLPENREIDFEEEYERIRTEQEYMKEQGIISAPEGWVDPKHFTWEFKDIGKEGHVIQRFFHTGFSGRFYVTIQKVKIMGWDVETKEHVYEREDDGMVNVHKQKERKLKLRENDPEIENGMMWLDVPEEDFHKNPERLLPKAIIKAREDGYKKLYLIEDHQKFRDYTWCESCRVPREFKKEDGYEYNLENLKNIPVKGNKS